MNAPKNLQTATEATEATEGRDVVLHEIDGIQEYDNNLPNWWLYLLYGSVLFAIVYWFTYETGGFADGPLKAYQTEVDRAAAAQASTMQVGEATAESLVALSKDATGAALGKQVFGSTCAPCHRGDGGGVVGPNLTDEFWLHGGTPEDIYKTISQGVSDKGMPAWGQQLGALRTQAVAAYVLTLRDTNAPGGKAAQGERMAPPEP